MTVAPGIRRRLPRYALLCVQLLAILAVIHVYRVESPTFKVLSIICFAGFAVHYWLPVSARRPFLVLFSMGAAFAVLDWRTTVLLHGAGLVFFAVLRARMPFAARLWTMIAIGAALTVVRPLDAPPIVEQLWPVLGAIFMFRMMVYLYDLRHQEAPPDLLDFLSYFYLLPNYYFLLFPVVDYRTFLHVRGRGDLDDVAQTGIRWITRGVVQLLLYRVVRAEVETDPQYVTTLPALVESMALTYLLYLRVSGQFHIAIGMLRLYGFDLPETHRRWLLASSISDFWRRINIYWKDFIVKLVYMPAFFALRRKGEVVAMCLATGIAFVATWILHVYQWFWLRGEWHFTVPDTLFWSILAVLVVVSLLLERRRRGRPPAPPSLATRVVHAGRVLATLVTITILWSMWQCDSLAAWLDLLTWWE